MQLSKQEGPALQAPSTTIRVLIADTESIFRTGIRRILGIEADIEIVASASCAADALTALAKTPADVLLLERSLEGADPELASQISQLYPDLRIILIVRDKSEDITVQAMRQGVRGIITRSITPELLVKCLRKVHAGQTWIDNQGVTWIIEAYRTQFMQVSSPRQRIRLTPKEMRIVAGVTQGLRNKDIASDLNTTEQVVKNYLRKIYDKLGISDRLELALYCMHHRLLDDMPKEN